MKKKLKIQNIKQHQQTPSKEGYTMGTLHASFRNMLRINAIIFIGLFFCASLLEAQYGNLNLTGNMTGIGTITVTRNINNNAAAAVTISPRVRLTGNNTAQVQYIGNTTQPQINFARLESWNNRDKTIRTTVQIDTVIFDDSFAAGRIFNLNGRRMTITDSISNSTNGTVTLNSGRVTYSKASGTQYLFAGAYDTLFLSGAAPKYLRGATTTDSIDHSGGSFYVNNTLTVNANYGANFGTIGGVTSTLTLGNNKPSVVANLTVSGGGQVINGNGLLTVTSLTGNAGTITALANSGAMTFSNAAANAGTITGGAGLMTFSNTLTQSAGTVTAGTGDIIFNNGVTLNGGSIAAANNTDSLHFASTLALNGASTLNLTNGRARFNNTVTSAAAQTLGSGSVVYYNGAAAQQIAAWTYGNLNVTNIASHNAAGNISVAGNLQLDSSIAMGANTLTITSPSSNVTGAGEVTGAVTRQHNYAANTLYRFNRAEVGLALNQVNNTNPSMTLTMTPGGTPSGTLPPQYASRKYAFASTGLAGTDSIRQLQLFYLDAERQGSPTENKFGIRSYNGSWAKLMNPGGTYTRTVTDGTPNNDVLVQNVSGSLAASVSEFGIFKTSYVTNQNNAVWATGSNWDEGNTPTSTDDAEIAHTGVTLTAVGAQASTLTINASRNLALSGSGALTVASTISIANLGGLTVGNGTSVTTTAGSMTMTGASTLTVNNGGTLTINGGDLTTGTGAVTVDGTITVNE